MLKFLFNLAQLFVIYWVTCKVLKFTLFRKFNKKRRDKYGKKRLSLIGKVWLLISRQLHSRLDGMLTKQSERFKEIREQKISLAKSDAQQDSKEVNKVVEFKKYQRKQVK